MKIITFDVGGTAIKFGMVDENFEMIFSEEFPTNEFEDTDNMVMYAMESKLREYEGQYDAIGISTAGQVDFENGMIHDGVGNIPNYNHSDLRGTFEKIFNVPVAVDNDVNCAAIGEAHFGAARGAKDFLCLTYGTGVGGCIYINGDVYRGSKFAAGEFGHMATHKDGRPCTCGRIGCYEAYSACRVFTKAVSDRMGKKMSGREIFKEENLKNPIVIEEMDKWEDEIALGLRNLCYIFNPSLIVLGGGIMSEILLLGHIRHKVNMQLEPNYKHVKIEKAQLGNKAGMLGAAWLANERLKTWNK
ncbi:MAG: ROK family protein [Clostridia bacterium]|nr:ROK family protein [Clostridia bacterium]